MRPRDAPMREAHRDLAFARGRAREHQVREVGAGDEQHQAGGRQQQPQRRLVVAAQRARRRCAAANAPSLNVEVVLRVLGAVARRQRLLEDRRRDRAQAARSPARASSPASAGRTRRETSTSFLSSAAALAARERLGAQRHGDVEGAADFDAEEARRRHADDVVGVAVERQRCGRSPPGCRRTRAARSRS